MRLYLYSTPACRLEMTSSTSRSEHTPHRQGRSNDDDNRRPLRWQRGTTIIEGIDGSTHTLFSAWIYLPGGLNSAPPIPF